MLRSFKDKKTERLYAGEAIRAFFGFRKAAERTLTMWENATKLRDLNTPPGNRLKKLSGDRQGQHSIRINDQWRICFVWKDDGPYEVEITDYH